LPDAESRLQQLNSNMAAMRRLMTSCFQKTAGEPLLPPSQAELLFLVMHKQPISLKELAAEMQLTPGSITQLVEPLERHDLIVRQPSAVDRRVVHIAITEAGVGKVEAIRQIRAHVSHMILEALSPEELDTMLGLQVKIIAHLKKTESVSQEVQKQ